MWGLTFKSFKAGHQKQDMPLSSPGLEEAEPEWMELEVYSFASEILFLPRFSYVTWGKLLNFSATQFPQLYNLAIICKHGDINHPPHRKWTTYSFLPSLPPSPPLSFLPSNYSSKHPSICMLCSLIFYQNKCLWLNWERETYY